MGREKRVINKAKFNGVMKPLKGQRILTCKGKKICHEPREL